MSTAISDDHLPGFVLFGRLALKEDRVTEEYNLLDFLFTEFLNELFAR